MALNSKYSYFNKFKAALRAAFNEGYLSINYTAKAKLFKQTESQREYLKFQELQNLINKDCKYIVINGKISLDAEEIIYDYFAAESVN